LDYPHAHQEPIHQKPPLLPDDDTAVGQVEAFLSQDDGHGTFREEAERLVAFLREGGPSE